MANPRPSTSYSYASTSRTSYQNDYTTSASLPTYGRRPSTAGPSTARPSTARPSTGRRSRAGSIMGGGESQQIICAVSEARGISPTVGIAFVNISTGEAVLSQICDSQFYVRTLNKLQIFDPTEILIISTAGPPNPKSKMYQVIEENIPGARLITIDRKYWSEPAGLEFIDQFAFSEDVQAIKVAIGGNYFATCCFAAALKYIDLSMSLTFAFHSLRIKYQPSEGTMMIDLSTIQSLELIQNTQNSKSKDCLFGVMNETLTPMGSRLLRSNILQPSTQKDVLNQRYDAVHEFTIKEDMFFQTRLALKSTYDVEKLLTSLIIIPTQSDIQYVEQAINNILMLKSFAQSVGPIFEALASACSEMLVKIRENCRSEVIDSTIKFIKQVINEDVTYQKTPLDLRNQRTYAVKSGVSGLLDVARQTFKEATEDVHQHITEINQKFEMQAETRYENARHYYLRLYASDFDGRTIPEVLINRYQKKGFIECQTLDLMKLNQRIRDSHNEVVSMSDKTIQELIENLRGEIPSLYQVCESIALLDMLAAFGQVATSSVSEYCRPDITDCIGIKSGRHPVREKIHQQKFVSNDIYASQQTRLQIITGCNMSGKSTYIRSAALLTVMAQVGSFVPAAYASFPIIHQLFARVSMDDSIEANVSTFASEMRETAFILRNIDKHSLAIIDELGRGTSSRDGLAIALSISEALVESKALVFFATHFRELAQIMSERPGVVNLHLTVDMSEANTMIMLYKIGQGFVKEEHYGLALARVVDLPPQVLEVAETVSKTLDAQAAAKKKSSKAFALARRRKLVLGLKETLKQAESGPMEGKALLSWLRRLQDEFVRRMDQIENDVESSDSDEGADEGEEGPEVPSS
ncbi:DNA mismatch repair protein-like protein MutS [Stipitochalara longipes BDJ]|nr:DNA mismatch repair protein-like protein MutS [Stipitochalara longipes BDJ]